MARATPASELMGVTGHWHPSQRQSLGLRFGPIRVGERLQRERERSNEDGPAALRTVMTGLSQ